MKLTLLLRLIRVGSFIGAIVVDIGLIIHANAFLVILRFKQLISLKGT